MGERGPEGKERAGEDGGERERGGRREGRETGEGGGGRTSILIA